MKASGEDKQLQRALKRLRVSIANADDERVTGDMAEVLEIINSHDVVFSVWQDPDEPDGVGMRIVKGVAL